MKYVQSEQRHQSEVNNVILPSLLLTLNKFNTFLMFFLLTLNTYDKNHNPLTLLA